MKLSKWALLTIMLAGLLAGGSALADPHYHRHVHTGIYLDFGVPPGWRWYYPPPSYYYPYPSVPVIVVPAPPPVYIERGEVQPAAPPAPADWYYCQNPAGYYPYVRECPVGWQRVPAQPPSR